MQRDLLEAWLQGWADRVLRLAYVLMGSRSDAAEDVAQDSLYHIARFIIGHPDFEPTDQWVWQVTRNAVRDWFRKQRREGLWTELGSIEESVEAPPPEDPLERMVIDATLNRMPEGLREVLALHYYLDLQTRDMARILHLSDGAVRVKLSRARALFRRLYHESQEEKEGGHEHV